MFSSGNIGSGPFFSLNALYAYKTGEHLVQLFLSIYKVPSLVLLLLLLLLLIREVKHHVCVKRQTRVCTTWPSFTITCRLPFFVSTHKLVSSSNLFFIVKNCFELSLSAHFKFWGILNLNLTFSVYIYAFREAVKLKLSNVAVFLITPINFLYLSLRSWIVVMGKIFKSYVNVTAVQLKPLYIQK